MQLKVIQEVISLLVFTVFTLVFFQNRGTALESCRGFYTVGAGGLFYLQEITKNPGLLQFQKIGVNLH